MKAFALFAALVSLGGCASAPTGHEPSNLQSVPAGGVRFLYNLDFGHAGGELSGRDGVLARAVAVLQRRVDALFKQGVVRSAANGIEVVLPDGVPAAVERYRRIALRPGTFQVKLVDDGSAYMVALAERLHRELFDFGDIVTVEDRWKDPAGGSHQDPYFATEDCDVLLAILRKLTSESPLPSDRELLIEAYGETSRSYRSYLVASSGGIDNADVDALAVETGIDRHPEVIVTLTAAGQRKFGDMTAGAIGRKIAVVIDGMIATAPMIIGPIRNGRVHVRFGVYPVVDESAQRAEAEDLALLLRSGPLPAPLYPFNP